MYIYIYTPLSEPDIPNPRASQGSTTAGRVALVSLQFHQTTTDSEVIGYTTK